MQKLRGNRQFPLARTVKSIQGDRDALAPEGIGPKDPEALGDAVEERESPTRRPQLEPQHAGVGIQHWNIGHVAIERDHHGVTKTTLCLKTVRYRPAPD